MLGCFIFPLRALTAASFPLALPLRPLCLLLLVKLFQGHKRGARSKDWNRGNVGEMSENVLSTFLERQPQNAVAFTKRRFSP
ncbi:hypothetical protein TH63_05965 [Rufibacter radiotolerans]|uniref:Uncharacterized protein n=1 Tax=Rufibacter radiotolerans TaxID=1379910 RepID=A0A0H4VIQ0_9BACT|nr:hypothetical protein TH63_05965 [Rufibacter radiotolerans]